jgi:hypothetical protein
MANAVAKCPDVVFELLGKGQSITPEASDLLPERSVKALDGVGFPCFLGHGLVLGCWHDACVGSVLIREQCGLLTIHCRNVDPQLGSL